MSPGTLELVDGPEATDFDVTGDSVALGLPRRSAPCRRFPERGAAGRLADSRFVRLHTERMRFESGLAFAAGLALIGAAWYTVERARRNDVPPRVLTAISLGCVAALVLLALSDWPSEWLNEFWADHSILAALLSTVLIVGAGLLGLEARSLHEQERMSDAMAGTAFAGLVNPVLDIDSALWALTDPSGLPDGWRSPGKPLRWIRDLREAGTPIDGRVSATALEDWLPPEDARLLIDQAIRRLVGSARNWAALASSAVDGRAALATLGQIRNDLSELSYVVSDADLTSRAPELLVTLRATVQQTAIALERASLVGQPRPELAPLPTDEVTAHLPERAARITAIRDGFPGVGGANGHVGPSSRVHLRPLLPEPPQPTVLKFWHR